MSINTSSVGFFLFFLGNQARIPLMATKQMFPSQGVSTPYYTVHPACLQNESSVEANCIPHKYLESRDCQLDHVQLEDKYINKYTDIFTCQEILDLIIRGFRGSLNVSSEGLILCSMGM